MRQSTCQSCHACRHHTMRQCHSARRLDCLSKSYAIYNLEAAACGVKQLQLMLLQSPCNQNSHGTCMHSLTFAQTDICEVFQRNRGQMNVNPGSLGHLQDVACLGACVTPAHWCQSQYLGSWATHTHHVISSFYHYSLASQDLMSRLSHQ